MRRTYWSTLPLFLALTAIPTSAFAQATDAATDLAEAYADACEDNDVVCLEEVQISTNSAPATPGHSAQGVGAQHGLSGPLIASLERRPLSGNVVEYFVDVVVGPGPYDHLGLHRVVREDEPYRPTPTAKSVMMVHGDVWSFDAAFLANGGDPASASVAVYLAQQGIDVWGVDLGWTSVPAEETDFSFMADWDFSRDIHDIRTALGLARHIRSRTGSGFGKMNLLGWSRGGQLGYGLVDGESQLPPGLRHVSGLIPVDVYLKTNVEQQRLAACSRLASQNSAMSGGAYANDIGKTVAPLGFLATFLPNDTTPAPPFQPLTNAQVGDLLGAATFLLANPPPVPYYHFAGGVWNEYGQVTGLAYQSSARWYDFIAKAKPYQPWRQLADAETSMCDNPILGDVTFDDHLSSVTIPVLYVGAGGGFGADGVYTTTLLGSSDVTNHVVHFFPTEARLFDVGHADIFQGTNAESLFWVPIRNWIQAH